MAELRLHEALKTRFATEVPRTEVRFLTDALENPIAQQQRLSAPYRIIGRSREEANRIKRESRVMVVIGNPPHVENSKGKAPWIEERRKKGLEVSGLLKSRPSLDEFRSVGSRNMNLIFMAYRGTSGGGRSGRRSRRMMIVLQASWRFSLPLALSRVNRLRGCASI